MKPDKKPRADSKLKNLPEEDQAGIWAMLHPTSKDTPAMTLEAVAVAIQASHGFSVAISTLSEWHSWYSLERRMLNARNRANQTALQLAANPDFTPEEIDRAAQTVFTSEMLEGGNVKGYVALATLALQRETIKQNAARIELSKQALEHEKQKLTTAAKTKIEAGLDALFAEIKGNPKAEQLFRQLQEVVKKA